MKIENYILINYYRDITKKLSIAKKKVGLGSLLILTSCSYFPTNNLKAMPPNNSKFVPVPVEKTNFPVTFSALGTVNNKQIIARVPQAKIAEIKVGQKVAIAINNNLQNTKKDLAGQIKHISPESTVVNNIPSIAVEIMPTETSINSLQTNENVTVNFTVGERNNVVVIPNVAIKEENNTKGVFVGAPHQTPQFVPISTGISNGDRIEVISGLKGTEHILIEASQVPKNGRKEVK